MQRERGGKGEKVLSCLGREGAKREGTKGEKLLKERKCKEREKVIREIKC